MSVTVVVRVTGKLQISELVTVINGCQSAVENQMYVSCLRINLYLVVTCLEI